MNLTFYTVEIFLSSSCPKVLSDQKTAEPQF